MPDSQVVWQWERVKIGYFFLSVEYHLRQTLFPFTI